MNGSKVVAAKRRSDRLRQSPRGSPSDETTLNADVCVVGIGAVPNDAWLAPLGGSIECHRLLRSCSAAGSSHTTNHEGIASWHRANLGRVRHPVNFDLPDRLEAPCRGPDKSSNRIPGALTFKPANHLAAS